MQEPHTDIATLLLGGFFGTLVRLILSPERRLGRWLAQIFVGLATATCLGWVIGNIVNLGAAGYVAIGFLVGTSSEGAIAYAQKRFGLNSAATDKNNDDTTPQP